MTAKPVRSGKKWGLTVRRAALQDLDTLVHQRRAMWEELGIKGKSLLDRGDRVYQRWARPRLKKRDLMAWLVESHDVIAGSGCLWLQPVQPRPQDATKLQPYLLSMYTNPDFRRRGVASLVVQEAISWCEKNGYQRLMLHASNLGRKVYENFGFKRTREMRIDLLNTQPRWTSNSRAKSHRTAS